MRYEIQGIYPDGCQYHAFVDCENLVDAIALAQGIRKVTTVKEVALFRMEDNRMVFHDKLHPRL